MPPRPFSIRIFLPDGSSDGLRVIEKSNWTGIGIVVPKNLFSSAKQREEFGRTGVYILVGYDDESEMPMIYIGQGDPIRPRLESHLARRDFWIWAIFFVTRDDSLNKAHIGYLETRLIQLAREAKRAKLDNQNLPQPSPLTEADAADMDSFLADILSILPLVGLSAFEKPTAATPCKTTLRLRGKGIQAEGYESAQGFVVRSGATAVVEESNSIHRYLTTLRKNLVEQDVLVRDGDFFRLTQDYEFGSPSTAASALLGTPASGPQTWKDNQGRSLKDLQQVDADSTN
jgi:uncharacterized protein DUF4357